MKKTLLLGLTFLAFAFTACADGEKLITFDKMPQNAQDLTKKYFPEDQVDYRSAYILYDAEFLDSSYSIVFTTGDGLEFKKDGTLKDFDCKVCTVPADLIPQPIKTYIAANAGNSDVKKIEFNRNDIEVELANGLELKFDLDGKLLEIDD